MRVSAEVMELVELLNEEGYGVLAGERRAGHAAHLIQRIGRSLGVQLATDGARL